MDLLQQARAEIDTVDAEMAALFERRMRAVADVVRYKAETGKPVFDAAREAAVLDKNTARITDEALRPYYRAFLSDAMSISRAYQRARLGRDTAAYQGVPGAWSHIALRRLFPFARETACTTWGEVFDAVQNGDAQFGVLPFENSNAGDVSTVLDLLYTHPDIIIARMCDLPIRQDLLGVPGAKVDEITQVFSHEQGFAQCPKFLGEHPAWVTTPYFNTAIAARHVAEMGDKHCAAIASRLAAKHYGLEILAPDIHTFDGNHTRFIVVSASPTPIGIPDKATVTFTLRHERGTLMRALSSFVAMGMNMTHIESRPLHNSNWEYCFYVDLTGNLRDSNLGVLMGSLQGDCENCRLLGVYQAAREDAHV